MNRALLSRAWPRGLAGRLTLFLILALAIAQAGLAVFLATQRDRVVEALIHSQALNQTVTLARLLNAYPASETDNFIAAFGSRTSCVWVQTDLPSPHSMTSQEQQLASTLNGMLHGINSAGPPIVAIEPAPSQRSHCLGVAASPPSDRTKTLASPAARADGHEDREDDEQALTVDVPLPDGRWLGVRAQVNLPPEFEPVTILSFLLSSAAVALVVGLVVRNQTRSLRALADASERFGRGETVPNLPASGPAEVGSAIHAFNTMQERLSEFLRDRLRLLASISHDLRTPITTLRLKAEFVEDDAVRADLVKTIDELAAICEATLAFTRAETTSEDTKVVDLSELVRDVEKEFALADRPIEEARMDPVLCACRPVALRRAIRNLIDNAIRYGHRARLSVFAFSDHALLRIDDEGPGIPPESIEDAFQPFVRLEPSRNTETGGLGLGLAISRSIVIAHGGKLTLSNLPGSGLRAEIALPAHA